MFSGVNVYLDQLKLCVVCINGRRYVCCGECYAVSNECDEPTSCIVQPIVAYRCEVMYFGCFDFGGELGFLNCDDVCLCWGGMDRHNLHRVCHTTVPAPPRVDGVFWSLHHHVFRVNVRECY